MAWPLIAAAAAAAAPAIGSLLSKDYESGRLSRETQRQALDIIRSNMPPDPESQKVYLEQLKSQGVLTPELEQAINLGPSAMEDIQQDPSLRQAQLDSLSKLAEIGNGGMSLQDQADLNKLRDQNAVAERGSREAILSNARQRGMGGSGMELAAQLANQQGSAQRAGQQSLDIAAQAQQRALNALMARGDLAGSMSARDFNQAAQIAAAKDKIAQFNAQNQQQVLGANVDRNNQAQKYNLGEAQRIADANTSMRNTQQAQNKQVYQDYYNNQLNRASTLSGQSAGLQQRANDSAAQGAAIGSAIGQGAGAIGQYQQNQDYLDYMKKRDGVE